MKAMGLAAAVVTLAGMAQAARDHAVKHLTDAAICRALLEEFAPVRIGE